MWMARNLQRTIGLENSCSSGSRFGVFMEKINQSLQRARGYKSVRIKQQDILPRTAWHCLIVGARKTDILTIFDEMHLGELLAHHPGTIIARGIIDHPDLKWHR
jgi:hypothetical protein